MDKTSPAVIGTSDKVFGKVGMSICNKSVTGGCGVYERYDSIFSLDRYEDRLEDDNKLRNTDLGADSYSCLSAKTDLLFLYKSIRCKIGLFFKA